MSSRRRWLGRLLTVALSVAWIATAACANAERVPAIHHHPMPCCPPEAGCQGCSAAACAAEQAPEKREIQKSVSVVRMALAVDVSRERETRLTERLRELTPGLRFAAAVFRLKEDLRI